MTSKNKPAPRQSHIDLPRQPIRRRPRSAAQPYGSTRGWNVPSRIELLDASSELAVLAYWDAEPQQRVQPAPGMFDGFLRLESAPSEAILTYARRWGPLWLCGRHNLPFRHEPDCAPANDFEPADEPEQPEIDPRALSDEEFARLSPQQQRALYWAPTWTDEAVVGWRTLSGQMRATLRIARRLHDGDPGDSADWDALPFLRPILRALIVPAYGDPLASGDAFPEMQELAKRHGLSHEQLDSIVEPTPQTRADHNDTTENEDDPDSYWGKYDHLLEAIGRQQMGASIPFQRQVLSNVLNYWMDLAGVRPRLEWTDRRPEIQLGGEGLFGALAVELLFTCSRTGGLAVCTSCGTPFLPEVRRAQGDRNAYCRECGLKAAARDAAARYRRTQKYRDTYQKWLEQR